MKIITGGIYYILRGLQLSADTPIDPESILCKDLFAKPPGCCSRMENRLTPLKKHIIDTVSNAEVRFPFADLVKKVSKETGISFKTSRKLILELAEKGEFEYKNELGHVFVVPSFNRPVRISERVVVHPPGIVYRSKKRGDVVITVEKSPSFGRGDHPSTRLGLTGIEKALASGKPENKHCLDVGCGTGILGIASLMMGMGFCFGVDTDPVAIHDAIQNAALNRLEEKTQFRRNWPGRGNFHLICANLRTPSLTGLKNRFRKKIHEEGMLVISGFKNEEANTLSGIYEDAFTIVNRWCEKGWSAFLLTPKFS